MKKRTLILPSVALLWTLWGVCPAEVSAASYTENDRTITLSIPTEKEGEVKTLQLTVVSDNIIRVEASPETAIPQKRKSLIIVGKEGPVAEQNVEETDETVTISTSKLSVVVDKKTGKMTYTDKTTGKVMLEEADGSKTFTPFVSPQTELPAGYHPTSPDELNWGKSEDLNKISIEDRSGYSWQLLFNSDDDEAFYGLGQHQSEEMNYKGRNEELFQYNTKVSIPFIMSTKNYGILWDSYSLCRWGNPNDYQQLNHAFTLYDKEGNEGHLTGTYTDKSGETIVRNEDSVYFEHAHVIGNLPQGFALNGSSVVYEGSIEAPVTATYRFILYYAGYIKVYIDGEEVVAERWRTAWNPNSYKFETPLTAGKKTELRIEWKPDGDVSYCGLRVATPCTEEEQGKLSIWSEMSKDMDYYFIAGESMDEVIKGYRFLTGKAQVMPKWAMGFWQSRERYKTQDEIVGNLAEFRKRGIPVDVIVQDWSYWKEDSWGAHAFDAPRYPDPQEMLDSVHAMNGRFLISVWPKFYCTTDHYKALDSNGWIYQQAIADSIRDWIGPGYMGSFYDAYSAGARKMFWEQMDESLFTKYNEGVDAWWMDASEPNVRDCTPIEYRKLLCGPTALGTSDEYFNAYSIVNADAIYNGQRSVNPDKRVFLLTRSGFAGLQRYSTATWSGDIGTRWEDMRAQMTAGINFSMSGVPFWGMDQGGFCVENRYMEAEGIYEKEGIENEDLKEWRELQARWNQFGCFIPLYRTHGQWPLREVWNLASEDHPCYKTIVAYDKLRYRMMPYLYSMAGWVNLFDYTMMRGLAMDFGDDSKVLNIGDQWMFGPAFMACPVGYYQARSRSVYLPKQCGWYDLYTGAYYKGGQTIEADAPYEKMPVFVREGSIIPFGPEIEWATEVEPDTINLYVYAGADGKFCLYEDEGTNYNYEKGYYTTIDFTYDNANSKLTIGERKGSYEGMAESRHFNVVLVGKDANKALDLDNPEGKMVEYSGKSIEVEL